MPIFDDREEGSFDARFLDRASVLLRDPLSELTRKRQTNLLVVSVVTILVALSLASMNEINFVIFKMSTSNPALIRYGLACLTTYFLILYGVGLVQDYQIYRNTIRPALKNLAD